MNEIPERPAFAHPQWATGVVLVFGVVALVAGLGDPVWWLVGSPALLVLVVFVAVRLRAAFGGSAGVLEGRQAEDERDEDPDHRM